MRLCFCCRVCELSAHFGTAGLMLDFSSVSSFSRIVLSELTMRRVAIVVGVDGDGLRLKVEQDG